MISSVSCPRNCAERHRICIKHLLPINTLRHVTLFTITGIELLTDRLYQDTTGHDPRIVTEYIIYREICAGDPFS